MSSQDLNPLIRPLPQYLPVEPQLLNPGSAALAGSGDVQLVEYGKVIWKYRLLIAAVAGIAVVLSVIYLFSATPLYSAQSRIRISTYEPVLAAAKIEDMLQQRSKEANYLETQIEEIKSMSLADRVLQDQAVRDAVIKPVVPGLLKRFFPAADKNGGDKREAIDNVSGYQHPVGHLKRYLSAISVKPVRRTSLVNVQVTLTNPEAAALVANKHALAYIDWVRVNRVEQQSSGLKFLRAQADELRDKVADLEREMADYAEANSIVALNKDENITVQKMSQLNKLLTDATAQRIETENQYRKAEETLNEESAGFDDQSIQNMRSELARLRAEQGQLAAKFTDSYPKMRQVRSQIAELKKAIQSQRAQIVSGLKSRFLAAAEEEKNLKEELEQQKSRAFDLSKRQVQYNVLNRELTSSRELLQAVLRQIKETALSVENNASNVAVVDFAVTPRSPSFPRTKVVLALGALLGLTVGLGLAFVLNYLDNTVRTPEQLSDLLQLPNLGVVPSFEFDCMTDAANDPGPDAERGAALVRGEAIKTEKSDLYPVIYVSNPRSLASEAYRTIRTGILLSQAGEPPRTILVTSAQSSEGKTTSAINLAASLASAGGRVGVIDADLRRPSLLRHFNMSPTLPGLVEVITGQRALEEVLHCNLMRRISILGGGRIPPNPAELLSSVEMAAIIDRLAAEFDYVIIDSPPILPVTDAMILSRYVDGVVMVVKGAATSRRVVRDASERLQSVGARILGTVLNDVDIKSGDYYYYSRYYHSYYRAYQEAHQPESRAVTH